MLAVWAVAFALLAVAAALPQGPTASLTVDDAYPALGQTVHFNASASTGHDAGNGRIVAYNFTFGDRFGTGWQAAPLAQHAYASSGTYVATVTVIDNRGETGSASVIVRPGIPPPPPVQAPDLVPIQAQLVPAAPVVNASANLTVVVLNRGGGNATAAILAVYDVMPERAPALVRSVPIPVPLRPSRTASVVVGPFAFTAPGNHTLRILVTNVTPAETSGTNNELDLQVRVLPAAGPGTVPGAGGGLGPSVSPVAIGLAAAGVAAGAGAGYLFLRRPPKGPLEPPPASPPDRSPPPIWPP